jgi:hypothetical protein
MKSLSAILAPPLLCLGVLSGIAIEKTSHVHPKDAAGYHARVKSAIERLNLTIIDDKTGIWNGQDIPQPPTAIQLLKPNKILSRRYVDSSDSRGTRYCDVLIVQCRDSRDMVGHYPENCYVNSGETLFDKRERDWTIRGVMITGTEYTFERYERGRPMRRCVYNFLVVPGVMPEGTPAVPGVAGSTIVRDIKGVNKAAEDYQRRHFGAAQFQFVFPAADPDMPRSTRDEIFATLMGSNMKVLEALNDVKMN